MAAFGAVAGRSGMKEGAREGHSGWCADRAWSNRRWCGVSRDRQMRMKSALPLTTGASPGKWLSQKSSHRIRLLHIH